jgi:hypothetical protein
MLAEDDAGDMGAVPASRAVVELAWSGTVELFEVRAAQARMGAINRAVEYGNTDASVSACLAPEAFDTGDRKECSTLAAGPCVDFPGHKTRVAV